MKKLSVVLLAVVSVAFAGYAEAAKPKKRTRNANRVGPYAVGFIQQTSYPNDQSGYEQALFDSLDEENAPTEDLRSSTKDSDIGYQATFGYRFNRYFAAEVGLAQFGSVSSKASANMDLGEGFVPVSLKLAYSAGGPIVSALGFFPVNDKFELFGRVGYLFASSEREYSVTVDGRSNGAFAPRGDSQDVVLGVGAAFHFGQVYTARLEYLQIDEVGDEASSGLEDMRIIGLGLLVRF